MKHVESVGDAAVGRVLERHQPELDVTAIDLLEDQQAAGKLSIHFSLLSRSGIYGWPAPSGAKTARKLSSSTPRPMRNRRPSRSANSRSAAIASPSSLTKAKFPLSRSTGRSTPRS